MSERPVHMHMKFSRQFGASTRLASSNSIKIDQKIRSELGKRNPTYSAANWWNEVTPDVRTSPTLPQFKRNAKKWVKENIPINGPLPQPGYTQ